MRFSLRPYQVEAIERTRSLLRDGKKRIVFCLPCGGGKTVVASFFVESVLQKQKRVLLVAHRRELIRQPYCTFVRAGVDPRDVGVVMGGVKLPTAGVVPPDLSRADDRQIWRAFARRRPTAPVQIASIDSLRHRELSFKPDVIVVDEGHRILSKSYLDLLEKYPDAVVIVLTATPERGDGRGLDEVCEELVVVCSYMDLVREGYLVEPRVFTTPHLPDVSRVRVLSSGDYAQKELAEACNKGALIGDIVEHWLRRARGKPTMGFAVDVEHSKACAARFVAAGVRAAHVDGSTPAEERDELFASLGSGKIEVLWNCEVMGEGTDVPVVKCVIMARPTESIRVFLQQAGRGSRPCGRCAGCEARRNGDLNARCLEQFVILDHAGNVARPSFGLPQDDRAWSLESRKRGKKDGESPTWTCSCMTVNPLSALACLDCGKERPAPEPRVESKLVEIAGELVEVASLTDDDKRRAWFEVVSEWAGKNDKRACPLKGAWCLYRFKERFGSLPPPDCTPPAWSDDERKRRADFDAVKAARGNKAAWAKGAKALPEAEEIGGFPAPTTTTWVLKTERDTA